MAVGKTVGNLYTANHVTVIGTEKLEVETAAGVSGAVSTEDISAYAVTGAKSEIVNDLTTGGATKFGSAESDKTLETNKVDKVSGKSLVSDTEITRLSSVTNQTLSGLGGASVEDLNTETSARQTADSSLQSQIDTINSTQNVVDIVGTYAALTAYVTTNLKVNDKIEVLVDESQSGSNTIYNWNLTAWVLIGSKAAYYSKSETDAKDTAQTFAAVVLTNPFTAGKTPRRIGDVAINTTSLEIWMSNSTTGADLSWEVAAQGPFGGTLITDAHSITKNGFYSAVSTASNLPTSDESFYISALCSNLSTTSAILTAIGLTTGKMYMQRKISGAWGAWVGGITQTELSYLSGVTSNIQTQINTIVAALPMSEQAIAEALNTLFGRIKALEEFISSMTIDFAQVDTINIVKEFNVFGKTNMILSGIAAPSIIPDFIGQQYINTASGATYTAKGTTAAGDWKQTNNA